MDELLDALARETGATPDDSALALIDEQERAAAIEVARAALSEDAQFHSMGFVFLAETRLVQVLWGLAPPTTPAEPVPDDPPEQEPTSPDSLNGGLQWVLSPRRWTRDEVGAATVGATWDPDTPVDCPPRIVVVFQAWNADADHCEFMLELLAQDGVRFETLELLHALSDAVGRRLIEESASLGSHQFFEGLTALNDGRYEIHLGS